MDRLTFGGCFCDIALCAEKPGSPVCGDGGCTQRKVWERLKQYEDLEEQGRLVELPCKIGTTVYRICKKKYDVDGYGMQWCEGWGIVTHGFSMGNMNELGKTVFLTREEAAKALKVR